MFKVMGVGDKLAGNAARALPTCDISSVQVKDHEKEELHRHMREPDISMVTHL